VASDGEREELPSFRPSPARCPQTRRAHHPPLQKAQAAASSNDFAVSLSPVVADGAPANIRLGLYRVEFSDLWPRACLEVGQPQRRPVSDHAPSDGWACCLPSTWSARIG
jgi:hypothetical protein